MVTGDAFFGQGGSMRFLGVLSALLGAAAMVLLPLGTAVAQEFPAKPIRLIVGFPPGGPADFYARTIGQKLAELGKQPVVVENRPGANGGIATEAVVRSPADGYTLLWASAGMLAVNPSLYPSLPYNIARDLAPVILAVSVPEVLVVHPAVQAKDVKQLAALAKATPGQIAFASSGSGSLPHLAVESLKLAAGIDLVHVPYKGAAPAVTDLVAGRVQLSVFDLPVLLPFIKDGRLRPLAVTSAKRSATLPEVPTLAEAGYPITMENWYGIAVPASTSKEVLTSLNALLGRAMQAPDTRERLATQGAMVVGGSNEQFAEYIREETGRWGKVVRAAKVTAD
jgi:tripartite-type tricarboxylate transporter receptor subunit TctC